MSKKQNILIDYCKTKGSINTSEANELLKRYHHYAIHVEVLLSRLVKAGVFVRKKIDTYELRKETQFDQKKLF
jgi:hypothetical protein